MPVARPTSPMQTGSCRSLRWIDAMFTATSAVCVTGLIVVDAIFRNSVGAGADCLVTACAMCHMNLEIRSTLQNRIPVLHFSEALALATGKGEDRDWFSRHLLDPQPMLRSTGLID